MMSSLSHCASASVRVRPRISSFVYARAWTQHNLVGVRSNIRMSIIYHLVEY